MKLNLNGLLILLLISMFCGVIIIGIGVGSAITPLQRISGPIVCGENKLELETQHYSYKPGQSGYTITWYCVDNKTGAREDKTFPVILTSGLIYSLILFVILIIWALTAKRIAGINSAGGGGIPVLRTIGASAAKQENLEGIDEKLRKLKELRDSDLITEQDYEKKKAEILGDL